ncbi:histidine kinase [Paenibacillus darwinianus]|uniref:histidine kinase n=2 Tax=Paenibacillus darwinianus TaxID=1380763 RepID=A0A9W5W6V0_9BACL|nr:histidine kinase [Paenibacillus darwinianus]
MRFLQFHRVHHKLGILIFSLFMSLMLILGLILYPLFVQFYFRQVVNELIHRGHSHASVLSSDFSQATLEHVKLMEKNAITSVIVLDSSGRMLTSSRSLPPSQNAYLQPLPETNAPPSKLVESDWRNQPYLVSKSPVTIQGKTVATVIMFTPSEPIRMAIDSLQSILIGVTITASLGSAVLIFIISKRITRPLVNMKNAVSLLSQNQYNLSLSTDGKDEIAELSRSLMDFSHELKHYRLERQDFLAEISHELRTPITYIRGYANILHSGAVQDPEERERFLAHIYDASNRLFHLSNELFELVQLDQTDYRIYKVHANVIPLIQQTIDELSHGFAEAEIDLQWNPPKKRAVTCLIDPARFTQVLINLLENAKRYTPSGGRVQVKVTELPDAIEILVADTGIGIPAENIHQIWQRFYRVEKSRSRAHGGAGLGLSICKRIVELHNGSIRVHSEQGKGSIFIVTLPRQ